MARTGMRFTPEFETAAQYTEGFLPVEKLADSNRRLQQLLQGKKPTWLGDGKIVTDRVVAIRFQPDARLITEADLKELIATEWKPRMRAWSRQLGGEVEALRDLIREEGALLDDLERAAVEAQRAEDLAHDRLMRARQGPHEIRDVREAYHEAVRAREVAYDAWEERRVGVGELERHFEKLQSFEGIVGQLATEPRDTVIAAIYGYDAVVLENGEVALLNRTATTVMRNPIFEKR